MKGRSFIRLFPSNSLSPFLRRWWYSLPRSPPRSLRACEHGCRGDEEMSSSVFVCVCMYSSSSLPSFSFGFFSLLAFVFLASHDHQFAGPLCAPLFLSLERRRRGEGQSQMAECGCGFMSCWWRLNATVYTSQLPLRSRLNSVKLLCLHALFLCNLNELLSNITALLFDRERSQLSLFNPVSLKLWVLTQSGYRHYILTPILRLGDMTIYPVRLISQSAEILHTVYSNISLL